ncbi:MAG TPA: 30S ribosomal protein S16 [Candidatus Tyrphobacter sp.]|nr:30S ribosomal protein S16 [Candidatus Tyrphobacter sp.]
MLAIKLKLIGKKHQRSFRVIVQEKKSKLRGKFIEDLGWYNPHTKKSGLAGERILFWIKNGAQPTETVGHLIRKSDSGLEKK